MPWRDAAPAVLGGDGLLTVLSDLNLLLLGSGLVHTVDAGRVLCSSGISNSCCSLFKLELEWRLRNVVGRCRRAVVELVPVNPREIQGKLVFGARRPQQCAIKFHVDDLPVVRGNKQAKAVRGPHHVVHAALAHLAQNQVLCGEGIRAISLLFVFINNTIFSATLLSFFVRASVAQADCDETVLAGHRAGKVHLSLILFYHGSGSSTRTSTSRSGARGVEGAGEAQHVDLLRRSGDVVCQREVCPPEEARRVHQLVAPAAPIAAVGQCCAHTKQCSVWGPREPPVEEGQVLVEHAVTCYLLLQLVVGACDDGQRPPCVLALCGNVPVQRIPAQPFHRPVKLNP